MITFVYRQFWLVIISTLLGACTTLPQSRATFSSPGAPAISESKSYTWHVVWFTLARARGESAPFYLDTLIAHRVIQPVLRQNQSAIALRRFHRRSGFDRSGHRFSFIFYAPAEQAAAIVNAIEHNELLHTLSRSQHIQAQGHQEKSDAVESTSDAHWPIEVQKSWPYFMYGASEAWLRLVDLQALEAQRTSVENEMESLEQMLEFYRDVQQQVTELWRTTAAHAYMHHLNAIFAYEPIFLRF